MNELLIIFAIGLIVFDCIIFAIDKYERTQFECEEKRIDLLGKLFHAMNQNPDRRGAL